MEKPCNNRRRSEIAVFHVSYRCRAPSVTLLPILFRLHLSLFITSAFFFVDAFWAFFFVNLSVPKNQGILGTRCLDIANIPEAAASR